MEKIACDALRAGKRLELRYGGFTRVVEVHAVGVTRKGDLIASVWQVRGGSAHDEPTGWKTLTLADISAAALIDEPSMAPRPGYAPRMKSMHRVICEL
jgi:hypothetical protein